MSQLADYPVLVDRSDAIAILGVTASTFDRLCREGRFENRVCAGPPRELYMASELRRYRAQDKRLGASPKSVTNSSRKPGKSAPLSVTPPAQIVAGAGNGSGMGNGTLRHCEGCGREFRPRRSDASTCSAACRQRAARRQRRKA